LLSTWRVRSLALIAISANIIAILQLGLRSPWTWVLVVSILAVAAIAPRLGGYTVYWRIRRILRKTEDTLKANGIKPDSIVTFDRSSAIFGAMLARRLSIGRLVAVPTEAAASTGNGPRNLIVGAGLKLMMDPDVLRQPILLLFHFRTGTTLAAALQYLQAAGLTIPQQRVIALNATPGAIAVWPGVVAVETLTHGEIPNRRFPWLEADYDRR